LQASLVLITAAALIACSPALASPPQHGHRTISSISNSIRFTNTPACASGELTLTRNPIRVPSGGSAVVQITDCNTASGDRMASVIYSPPSCYTPTDSKIGNNGDGGSDASGNIAIIAGSAPCAGSYVEITDMATGAVVDAPIIVP
jgi:hypothetical protein